MTHPEQVFSRDSLLEIVWGYDSGVDSQRTVDVHIRHLREKAGTRPRRSPVAAHGTGNGLRVHHEAPGRLTAC